MHQTIVIGLAVLLLAIVPWDGARSQQVVQVYRSIGGNQPLIRPVQITQSPSGSRLAICDKQGNRIYVIDTDGNPIWTIGSGSVVTQPVLLSFESDDALLYYVKQDQTVYRSREASPELPDTVATVTDSALEGLSIDRVIPLDKGLKGYLVLDQKKATVFRLKADFTLENKLILPGSRKGRLWAPTDMAVDLSGNIIVADEGNCPVQAFTANGKPLFCGSWNLTEAQRSWNASAVGVEPGEVIWVADVTNLYWRVFDRAGIQTAQYPFAPPLFSPNALTITADNLMYVADDNGAIIVLSLP
ncbi:hypothetical protein C3F09_02085 [candidate division GN15 bacterium]|uniref:SMP-30/Gluconolactonase/LRE-like region domain-containing protein n=1 Tax=candidate division GN15 bacterium TaxID=2072418 RepID=A0A855X4I6_9BACT|nr:MAG: hypothetical protein C3F09_02085 [candidate division GN15 bacterium]